MNSCTELNKKNVTALYMLLFVVAAIVICAVIARPQVMFIANKLGINMTPDWLQSIVDWVSAGGTIAGAFAAVLGITIPGWLAAAVTGFGLVSA